MRRVTSTNLLFWVNIPKPPSRKYYIRVPAKCKTSVYVLMEICLHWSKRLGPQSNQVIPQPPIISINAGFWKWLSHSLKYKQGLDLYDLLEFSNCKAFRNSFCKTWKLQWMNFWINKMNSKNWIKTWIGAWLGSNKNVITARMQ